MSRKHIMVLTFSLWIVLLNPSKSYGEVSRGEDRVPLPTMSFDKAIAVPGTVPVAWYNVSAVAWCRDATNQYLAVGDKTSGVSVFSFNTVTATFKQIPVPAPSGEWRSVSSVAWCYDQSHKYLAVGDIDNGQGAFVYSFDDSTQTCTQVPLAAPKDGWRWVSSVAWCFDGTNKYLAVGDMYFNKGVSIFSFDGATFSDPVQILTSSSATPSYNIAALSWCCDGTHKYLAVADGYDGKGVYVVNFDGTVFSDPIPMTPPSGGWGNIRSIDWCTDQQEKYLVVGDAHRGNGAYVFGFDGTAFSIPIPVPVPSNISSWGEISAVAWCCDGTQKYLAVGDQGNTQEPYTVPSSVYAFSFLSADNSFVQLPSPIPQKDWTRVSSLAWYCVGQRKYLAAGDAANGKGLLIFKTDGKNFSAAIPVPAPKLWLNVGVVAWCSDTTYKYLALGDTYSGKGAYVFRFNSATGRCNQIVPNPSPSDKSSWGYISSLSWCRDGNRKYLAIGDQFNGVYVFGFTGTRRYTKITIPAPEKGWGFVSSVAWCCNGTNKYLAVGSYTPATGALVYVFDGKKFTTKIQVPIPADCEVSSLAWCYDSNNTYLAVGDNRLGKGVYIYRLHSDNTLSRITPDPVPSQAWGSVKSLAWYCNGVHTYLVVGDVSNNQSPQVFSFDGTTFATPLPVPVPLGVDSWGNVSSVAWCCTERGTYLTIGDQGDSYHNPIIPSAAYTYSFDSTNSTFTQITPNPMPLGSTQWGMVKSVAWDCGTTGQSLAIGDVGRGKGAYIFGCHDNNTAV